MLLRYLAFPIEPRFYDESHVNDLDAVRNLIYRIRLFFHCRSIASRTRSRRSRSSATTSGLRELENFVSSESWFIGRIWGESYWPPRDISLELISSLSKEKDRIIHLHELQTYFRANIIKILHNFHTKDIDVHQMQENFKIINYFLIASCCNDYSSYSWLFGQQH